MKKAKNIAIVILLGLFSVVSCKKKQQCEAAKNRTEDKMSSYLKWQDTYYSEPTDYNKSKYELAKQNYKEAVKNENSSCK